MKTTTDSLTSFADELHLEQCHAYVIHHLKDGAGRGRLPAKRAPAITLTFEVGSGGREVAQGLTTMLRSRQKPDAAPWTVFDRELIEAVLAEHNLPASLAPSLREEHRSYIRDVVEELLDLRPPSWVMTPKIEETILHLAQAGNVILMGHCSSLITQSMPNVFHARLVAPLETRVERVRQAEGIDEDDALEAVKSDDRHRSQYAKQHYHRRSDDDLLYNLVVNTGRVSFGDAAELIATAAQRHFAAPGVAMGLAPRERMGMA